MAGPHTKEDHDVVEENESQVELDQVQEESKGKESRVQSPDNDNDQDGTQSRPGRTDTLEKLDGDTKVEEYLAHLVESGIQLSTRRSKTASKAGVEDRESVDSTASLKSEWELNLALRKGAPTEAVSGREEEGGSDEEEGRTYEGDEENEDEDDDRDTQEKFKQAEAAEAQYKKKLELIDHYILAKKDYKFMLKKNAYLQDKLYKICVRKGFIVENKEGEDEGVEKGKKKKRKFTVAKTFNQDHNEFMDDVMPEGLTEEEQAWEAAMAEQNEGGGHPQGSNQGGNTGGIRNFMEAALESKYIKVVKRIWDQEKSKMSASFTHEVNLQKIRDKSEKWEKIHQEKFVYLMDQVKEAYDTAIDSNTGRHLIRGETDLYIEEIYKIHSKLCKTMIKMYQNRHGLEFALKQLEETEIQGEGLQMLEYEQLQAENYSLKEKLEDRQKDVENIKGKIAHAVQILAHFRECMNKLEEKMDDGNSKLSIINKRVYQVREITDVVTQRYEMFKEDERNLVSESGLLDNTKLLRDFEKTHYDVLDLKEEKRKLQKLLATKTREVEEIQSKIRDVQMNLPELKRIAKLEQEKVKSIPKEKDEKEIIQLDSMDGKRKKMERLEYLLEKRTIDPKPTSKPIKINNTNGPTLTSPILHNCPT